MSYKAGQIYRGSLIEGEPITLQHVAAANALTPQLYNDFRNLGFVENGMIPPHKVSDAKAYLSSRPEWNEWYRAMKGWHEVRHGLAPLLQNRNIGTIHGLGEEFGKTDGNIAHMVIDPHIQHGAIWNPNKMADLIAEKDSVTPNNIGTQIVDLYDNTHPATQVLLSAGGELKNTKQAQRFEASARDALAGPQGVGKQGMAKAALYEIENSKDKFHLIREFVRNEPDPIEVLDFTDKDLIALKKSIELCYIYKKRFFTEEDFIKGMMNPSVQKEPGSIKSHYDIEQSASGVYEYVKKHPDSEFIDFLVLKMAMDEYVSKI